MRFVGLVIFLFQALVVFAQYDDMPGCYLRPVKYNDYEIQIVPMEEDGLALINKERAGFAKPGFTWRIVILDTLLQTTIDKSFQLESKYTYTGYDYDNGKLYLLYKDEVAGKSLLMVVRLSLTLQTINKYTIESDFVYALSHFEVADDKVLLGGQVASEPLVMVHDLPSGSAKVVPGFFKENYKLLDVRPNIGKTFNILLSNQHFKQEKLIIKTFDLEANLLLEDEVTFKSTCKALTGITSTLKHDNLIVTGTWTTRNNKKACGLYTWHIEPYKETSLQYITFSQLNSFLNYLKPAQAKRIRKKNEALFAKDKLPKFFEHATPYRMEENETGFSVLAEVEELPSQSNSNSYFHPQYGYIPMRRRELSSPNAYGNSGAYRTPNYNTETINVKVMQSVVINLDHTGNWVDDFSFPTDDLEKYYGEHVTDFTSTENGIVIAHKMGEFIFEKGYQRNGEKIRLDTIRLLDTHSTAMTTRKKMGGIRRWYKHIFYCWGYMTNRKAADTPWKSAFFIEKNPKN